MKIILFILLLFSIINASSIEVRALHLVIRGGENIKEMKSLVLYAKKNHFNTLILMLANGVNLKSLHSKNNKRQWSTYEFKEFVDFARKNNFNVIPEVKFLTHQEKLFSKNMPHLLFNKTTYDVHNEYTYKYVFNVIDEVIELTGCSTFHIGHDEVAGNNYHIGRKWISLLERISGKVLKPEEYLYDIKKIHKYLANKNVKTMMWGDMFLNKYRFSTMLKKHLNGTSGFDKIIHEIPKDIIIADWHYFDDQKDFPSYVYFKNLGFTVYGAAWKNKKTLKNFISYIKKQNYEHDGMILTTWYKPTSKQASLIKDLIYFSGKEFIRE